MLLASQSEHFNGLCHMPFRLAQCFDYKRSLESAEFIGKRKMPQNDKFPPTRSVVEFIDCDLADLPGREIHEFGK